MLWADILTNTADILNTTAIDGEVRYDVGDVRDDKGIGVEVAAFGVDGFVSMPNLPDSDGCARAIYIEDGDEKIIIGTVDARYADKVGTLEYGDRAIISKGAQRLLMKQGNESVTLYTERADGTPMMATLSKDDEIVSLFNGSNYIEISKDGITIAVKDGGWLRLDSEGVQVGGKTFAANTKGGVLGIVPPSATSVTNGIAATVAGGAVAPFWLVQL